MMEISGFTLLRNGVKYDYPFEESLRTVKPGGIVKGKVVGVTATHVLIDNRGPGPMLRPQYDSSRRHTAEAILDPKTRTCYNRE